MPPIINNNLIVNNFIYSVINFCLNFVIKNYNMGNVLVSKQSD